MNDMFGISVKCLPHTEELLASELKELGVQEIEPARRIVHGLCDMTTMQRVCYSSRLALRVLVPLESFSIRKVDDLYKKCLAMEWDNWMLLDQTFAIDSFCQFENEGRHCRLFQKGI
jgi:putative N6-adenine-specific DNA methylase